jgi:UrcA family protein
LKEGIFNGAGAMTCRGFKILAGCAALLGVTSVSCFAQTNSGFDSGVNERITVYPPQYSISRAPVPDAAKYGFAVAERMSMSLPVSYSDLDLSNPADVKELENRIAQTATDVCHQLNKQFPSYLYPSVTQFPARRQDCVQTAVTNAMAQVMTNRRLADASASR